MKLISVIFALCGLIAVYTNPSSAQFFNRGNAHETVELVRSGTFYDYPGKAIGPTFEIALDAVQWSSFVSQAGQTVVEVRSVVSQRVRDSAIEPRADEIAYKLAAAGAVGTTVLLNQFGYAEVFKSARAEIERSLPCGLDDDCLSEDQFTHHSARVLAAMELNLLGQWQVGDEAIFQFVIDEDSESFELAVTLSDSFNQLNLDQILQPIFGIGGGLIR